MYCVNRLTKSDEWRTELNKTEFIRYNLLQLYEKLGYDYEKEDKPKLALFVRHRKYKCLVAMIIHFETVQFGILMSFTKHIKKLGIGLK